MSEQIDNLTQIIWDYHHLNHRLQKADCIFILCSNDLRVADHAAKLFLAHWAPVMIISGGLAHQGDLLDTGWKKSEAEIFADRVMELGVPKDKIILENKATNTGENVLFTEKILKERNLEFKKFIVVQKPFMERRAYATIKKHWPDKEIIITSPDINYQDYPNQGINKEDLINIIVGDLQRVKIYSELGYQISQDIPDEVWQAYQKLVELGYTKHLIKK